MNPAEIKAAVTIILLCSASFNALADALALRLVKAFHVARPPFPANVSWKFESLVMCYIPSKFHRFMPEWSDLQWAWHLAKWIHFYPPLLALGVFAAFDFFDWLIVIAACTFLWKMIYSHVKPDNSRF